MKRLVVVFLLLVIAVFYVGCSENYPSDPNIPSANTLEKTYAFFSGTSTTTAWVKDPKIITLPDGRELWRGLIVTTNDVILDEPRVNGEVTWVVNLDAYPDGSDKRWGTGELIIPNMGRWDMTYKGWYIPGEGVTYEVDGQGKGELRGLKAHWTYFVETPGNPFEVTGFIIEK
jgi:hypothetical protein